MIQSTERFFSSGAVTFRVLVFSVLLSLLAGSAQGSHSMGADMTYTCLGNNRYVIKLAFYRDCAGIPAPGSVTVDISSSCATLPSVTLFPTADSPYDSISPECVNSSQQSTCHGGTLVGVERWTYVDTVTISQACSDWRFSWSTCCRNTAITNILNPGGESMYISALLNNLAAPCNSSPIFSNFPVPFTCVGQRFTYNHGVYDVDGDSLYFQLVNPRNGPLAGDTIQYDSGFTAAHPFTSSLLPVSNSVRFNTATGEMIAQPTSQQVTVLAVLVSEYRNGVLIGQVIRDIQLNILPCNNLLPLLGGFNGFPQTTVTICADVPYSATIGSRDPDIGQTTAMSWDFGIAGANLAFYGSNNAQGYHQDSALFTWTPTQADIGPHFFTLTVIDDNCPYKGIQVGTYVVNVTSVDVNAGTDQTISCSQTATLTASGSSGSGNYTYTWNPGRPDSAQGAVLGPVSVGSYVVQVYDNTTKCRSTDTVNVLPGAGNILADYSFSTNCSGTNVVFSDLSSGGAIATWHWDFGDGATSILSNPSHQYANSGTYLVTLVVSTPAGCQDSTTQQVIVNANIPTAQFTATAVCAGSVMPFSDGSSSGVTTYAWDFGDPASGVFNSSTAQNPGHTFSAAGTYTVGLTVTNAAGCSGSVTNTVTVNANPTVAINAMPACDGQPVTLSTAPATFTSYNWSGPNCSGTNATVTFTPPFANTYNVSVIDANGCAGTASVLITPDTIPVVSAFGVSTICLGRTKNLFASANNISGGTFSWQPGGLTGSSCTVSPIATTTYTVTCTSAAGCIGTDTVTVTVNSVSVQADPSVGICNGSTITLNASTTAPNQSWTPGGASGTSITVTPNTTTTYTVTVSDNSGCTAVDQVQVVVNEIPVADFTPSAVAVCQSTPVTLADNSSVVNGSIASWTWDLGNGSTSTSQSPSVNYATSGTFNIQLIVTSNANCIDTVTGQVTVNPNPVASFSTNDVCRDVITSFTNSSFISDGSNLTYAWDLGDGTTFGGALLGHIYSTEGAYTVTLVVSSPNNCYDTLTQTTNVFPLPIASFTNTYACVNDPALLDDNSFVPSGFISTWAWSLGDGSTSGTSNPAHVYSAVGEYTISLLVATNHGCLDSTTGVIRIAPLPTADFASADVCLGFPTPFNSLSASSTGTIASYQWILGDGSRSTDSAFTHIYPRSGSFDVTLEVTSDSGCVMTVNRPGAVNVIPPPPVNFTDNSASASDLYPTVDFNNNTGVQGTYFWSFGDGDTSTQYSPSHVYAGTGQFPVQLICIDTAGCIDSVLRIIEIRATSFIYIPNTFTPNGDSKNEKFQVYGYNLSSVVGQIYNRWGEKIYDWDGLSGGWDGTINGIQVQADVYDYRVVATDVNNVRKEYYGRIKVAR